METVRHQRTRLTKIKEKHSTAQGTLARAARNNREKEKALRQKTKPVGAREAVQKAAQARESPGEKSCRRGGKKHTRKL